MQSKIHHTSHVIDFLDVNFNSDQVSSILKSESDQLLSEIKIDTLEDWEIHFRVIYGEGNMLRIFKKNPSYVKYKQKEIVIHIPIPTKDIAPWGVEKNQHINLKPPSNPQDFAYLGICFTDYTNQFDYIVTQIRKAILFCLEDGFTVNGKKVKLNNPKA